MKQLALLTVESTGEKVPAVAVGVGNVSSLAYARMTALEGLRATGVHPELVELLRTCDDPARLVEPLAAALSGPPLPFLLHEDVRFLLALCESILSTSPAAL